MTWLRRLYPAMIAAIPVFGLAEGNPGFYRLRDVVVLASALAATALVIEGALVLAFRARASRGRSVELAALVTAIVVVAFYLYDPFPLGPLKHAARSHAVTTAAMAVTVIALASWAAAHGGFRRLPAIATVNRVLGVGALLVLSMAGGEVLWQSLRATMLVRRSAYARQLARPVPIRPALASGAQPRRDVYVILLDAYGSADALRDRFGIDNRAFEDSLRAAGFRIPTHLRSNYPITILSLTSLLNFAPMQPLAREAGATLGDYTPAAYLLEHNRAARFLHDQEGYAYLFFPSAWFEPTEHSAVADWQLDPYDGVDLGRLLYRSEFAQTFVRTTPLRALRRHLTPFRVVNTDHATRTLAALIPVARDPRPTFAFAHVLMPHPPFVTDRSCHPAQVQGSDTTRLAAELACLNRLTLRTVHGILASSAVAPIIIIQGDHGTQSLGADSRPGDPPSLELARERFRPLGAYYLPGGAAAGLPDTTSVVNVLRYVFSYYFGADLPPLPNTMYYAHWRRPYALTEIGPDFRPVPLRIAGH